MPYKQDVTSSILVSSTRKAPYDVRSFFISKYNVCTISVPLLEIEIYGKYNRFAGSMEEKRPGSIPEISNFCVPPLSRSRAGYYYAQTRRFI